MNSIPSDRGQVNNALVSGHTSSQTLNANISLDAGLTIKTREGDIVTLSSSQFSEFNASEYGARGEVWTESGHALVENHTREITLTTGELFSFSVQGDLNQEELADIAAIVQGVDGIISEMGEGDMDDALELAMSMGGYDSVSMYSADITLKQSYSMVSEQAFASTGSLPGNRGLGKQTGLAGLQGQEGNAYKPSRMETRMEKMLERMEKIVEKQEEKILAHAQQPLSKLFAHHLGKIESEEETPKYKALEAVEDRLDQRISDRIKKFFESTLNQIV